MPFRKTTPDEDRFWSHVAIGAPNECWPWQGGTFRNGYGQFNMGSRTDQSRRNRKAHRVAYWFTNGEWPEPIGRHSCDNPSCCNPSHVVPGSNKDNTHDMDSRGRRGRRKLSARQVQIIRVLLGIGLGQTEIARRYDVKPETIFKISRRMIHRNVPEMNLKEWTNA